LFSGRHYNHDSGSVKPNRLGIFDIALAQTSRCNKQVGATQERKFVAKTIDEV